MIDGKNEVTPEWFLFRFREIMRLKPPRNSSADPFYYAYRELPCDKWKIAEFWLNGYETEPFVLGRDDEFETVAAAQLFVNEHLGEKFTPSSLSRSVKYTWESDTFEFTMGES